MTNNDRRYVEIRLGTLDVKYTDFKSLKNDIAEFEETAKEQGLTNLEIDYQEEWYGGEKSYPTFYVVGKRLENDTELAARLKVESDRQAELDQRDREAYNKLKAKFG